VFSNAKVQEILLTVRIASSERNVNVYAFYTPHFHQKIFFFVPLQPNGVLMRLTGKTAKKKNKQI